MKPSVFSDAAQMLLRMEREDRRRVVERWLVGLDASEARADYTVFMLRHVR